VPSGSVTINTQDTVTTDAKHGNQDNPHQVLLPERIVLGPNAVLDVSGGTADNALAGKLPGVSLKTASINGGSIYIRDGADLGEGVFLTEGSVLDVSGGWEIKSGGKTSAGKGGQIEMAGASLVTDGALLGHGAGNSTGGKLLLHADNVTLLAGNSQARLPAGFGFMDALPAGLLGTLALGVDRLDTAGFSSIGITSVYNLVMETGAVLRPSLFRLAAPSTGAGEGLSTGYADYAASLDGTVSTGSPYIQVPFLKAGSTSVSLAAGEDRQGFATVLNDEATLTLEKDAGLVAAPGGKATVKAPEVVVAGEVLALAGPVDIKASLKDLWLKDGARISAAGVLIPNATPAGTGLPAGFTAKDAGAVLLAATSGKVRLDQGATVDVSGTAADVNWLKNPGGEPVAVAVAGAPGTVSISSLGAPDLLGELWAKGLPGLPGGAFTLARTSLAESLEVNGDFVAGLAQSGFDSITLRSDYGLSFMDSIAQTFSRSVTLDAPRITAAQGAAVSLASPWTTLANTSRYVQTGRQSLAGDAVLSLSGGFLDVTGSVALSGFSEVSLFADKDARLTERQYRQLSGSAMDWDGLLKAPGKITLTAARIYPTTLSSFTVSAGDTVRFAGSEGETSGPIVSAGGNLLVEAPGILHEGFLAAPMGRLELKAEGGRVYLAAGSVLSVAGSSSVPYGSLEEVYWTVLDHSSATQGATLSVDQAPQASITLSGAEVIVREDALLDGSGGGSVFATQFVPGTKGTVDPLTKEGRYVLIPDGSVVLPGAAIHITGGNCLPAGTYSILPAGHAFLPGAVVVEDLGARTSLDTGAVTSEGYPVALGCLTETGTGLHGLTPRLFAVRTAAGALAQGDFNTAEFTAGNGAAINLGGGTTVMNGTVAGRAQEGFTGAMLTLSGADIELGTEEAALPEGFGFETAVPPGLQGKLLVSAEGLTGLGLGGVALGASGTATVLVKENTRLSAPLLTLFAGGSITLLEGALLSAPGEGGVVSLLAPGGTISVAEGAAVQAGDSVVLDADNVDFAGDLRVEHSGLSLASAVIHVVPEGWDGQRGDGLYLTQALWETFLNFGDITLLGREGILFYGNVSLDGGENLTLDTPVVAGVEYAGGSTVLLKADEVVWGNTGAAPGATLLADTGILRVEGETIRLSGGQTRADGFSEITFASSGEIVLEGRGGFGAEGNITLAAARVAVGARETGGGLESADYTVDAGVHLLHVLPNGQSLQEEVLPAGNMALSGGMVEVLGTLCAPGGTLRLEGENGVTVGGGGVLDASGDQDTAGGDVELVSARGAVTLAQGSRVDVSAGGNGEAGSLFIEAVIQGAVLPGEILGHGEASGGEFSLHTLRADDVAALAVLAATGGFDRAFHLQAALGDLVLGQGALLAAKDIRLVADSGNISLGGTLDASGDAAGQVGLWAMGDITLADGSMILANAGGAGEDGGDIVIGSENGTVVLQNGASADVAAGQGGEGGVVHFRALRTPSGVNMSLAGAVTGASRVEAEAVAVVNDTTITASDITSLYNPANSYISANKAAILAANPLASSSPFHLLAGIEVRSTGDLTLGTDWKNGANDLTKWRFGGEPGVLTLRAAGNLTLSGSIADHETSMPAPGKTVTPSWGVNLAAGADLASPWLMAVREGQGDLSLAANKTVYTQNAPLWFASGRDTVLNKGAKTGYVFNTNISESIATYHGDIEGRTGRDVLLKGGAVQSSTGDIGITVGRNLSLDFTQDSAAIRTTGEVPLYLGFIPAYWSAVGGGDIRLDVAGNVAGSLSWYAWDDVVRAYDAQGNTYSAWGPSYDYEYRKNNPLAGIAAMGGGDLHVETGGDFACQAGTFGVGDLSIYSHGNLDGRFVVKSGEGALTALGNFGSKWADQSIGLFDARFSLTAMGDIQLGTLHNPSITHLELLGQWNLGYTEDTSASLVSRRGDVTITGKNGDLAYLGDEGNRARVLPPTVSVTAAGNIRLLASLALAPASHGNLVLVAGGDIDGAINAYENAAILMPDLDPDDILGSHGRDVNQRTLFSGAKTSHADTPVHAGDGEPVSISAGGDVENLQIFAPKAVEIRAGLDVKNIYLFVQNLDAADISLVSAGRDVLFSSRKDDRYDTGIELGGPGTLAVLADGGMDLGTSRGVQTVGNNYNTGLGQEGASIVLASGYDTGLDVAGVDVFYDALRAAGVVYSTLLAKGEKAAALAEAARARAEITAPFLGAPVGTGNVDIVRSQITTNSGGDITILAAGDLNVGLTAIGDAGEPGEAQSSGINTQAGGGINIYTSGDVNVNEARVMTWLGGDISIWTDKGDINAGRGAKTAVNAGKPRRVNKGTAENPVWVVERSPAAVGSGLRTMTYDPDGLEGPSVAPEPGDMYLFASEGLIDAGEAGISGKRIILGATAVVNAQNISFSQGSVGVPSQGGGAINMGALTGAGNLAETAKAGETAAAGAGKGQNAREMEKEADSFLPRWLDVKVTGYVEEEQDKDKASGE
jgi:hypothetical protein